MPNQETIQFQKIIVMKYMSSFYFITISIIICQKRVISLKLKLQNTGKIKCSMNRYQEYSIREIQKKVRNFVLQNSKSKASVKLKYYLDNHAQTPPNYTRCLTSKRNTDFHFYRYYLLALAFFSYKDTQFQQK